MTNNINPVEPVDSLDEATLLDHKWLEAHGHGSRVTIWRKRKEGKFPDPLKDNKWTLKQIKDHVNSEPQSQV